LGYRLAVRTCEHIDLSEPIVCKGEVWRDLQRLASLRDRVLVLVAAEEYQRQRAVDRWRKGIQLLRSLDFVSRLVQPASPRQIVRVPLVRARIVRVQVNRPAELLFRARPVPIVEVLDMRERGVRFGEGLVDLQRSSGGGARLGERLARRQ